MRASGKNQNIVRERVILRRARNPDYFGFDIEAFGGSRDEFKFTSRILTEARSNGLKKFLVCELSRN